MILRNLAITFSWRTGREWIQWMDSFLHWALLYYWINSLSEVSWSYWLEKDELKKTENPTPILPICIWTVHSLRSCEAQPITCRMRKREKQFWKLGCIWHKRYPELENISTDFHWEWKPIQLDSFNRRYGGMEVGGCLSVEGAQSWESRRLVIHLVELEYGWHL